MNANVNAPVSISVARAREIMSKPANPCNCGCAAQSNELRAAANTIISQAQADLFNESRIAELERALASTERRLRLAIEMISVALKPTETEAP